MWCVAHVLLRQPSSFTTSRFTAPHKAHSRTAPLCFRLMFSHFLTTINCPYPNSPISTASSRTPSSTSLSSPTLLNPINFHVISPSFTKDHNPSGCTKSEGESFCPSPRSLECRTMLASLPAPHSSYTQYRLGLACRDLSTRIFSAVVPSLASVMQPAPKPGMLSPLSTFQTKCGTAAQRSY